MPLLVYDTVRTKGDSNFNKAIVKFIKNYNKMNLSQNTSSLSCYGKMFLNASRGKIKVQPTAVARRKVKNGSRQKTDTSRKRKLDLPTRKVSTKREHYLSKIIDSNKPSAKKAGRTMTSTTRSYTKKTTKVTKLEKV